MEENERHCLPPEKTLRHTPAARAEPRWDILTVSLAYAALYSVALFVELCWEYERFRALAWESAPVVFLWIAGTSFAGLGLDRQLTLAGEPNGLAASIGIHTAAALVLFVVLQPFLPDEPTVQANFQTFPVPAGYLKSILYFLFLILIFWLPAFHFVMVMHRELREGRAENVREVLRNTPESLRPRGTIYPRFSVLLTLWVVVLVVGLIMTFHLFDNLKPDAHLNLFMSLVQVRFSLYFLLGTGCLVWYSRALDVLKRECLALLALQSGSSALPSCQGRR